MALNAQFYWQYGDPIIAVLADAIAWRTPITTAEAEGAASGRWDAEDEQGLWPPAGDWLNELSDLGRPISLIFTGDDPGWWFLRDRVPRRLAAAMDAGAIGVDQVPELDHGLQRSWLRPRAVEAFRDALERVRDGSP